MIGNYFDNSTRPQVNSSDIFGILQAPSYWRYSKALSTLSRRLFQLTLQVVYGINALPEKDPYIDIAKKAFASLIVVGNPGSFLVDIIPTRSSPCIINNIRVSPDCCS
jgi:hypothetical protein